MTDKVTFLEVELPEGAPTVRFATAEEATKWVKTELEAWQRLANEGAGLRRVVHDFNQLWEPIKHWLPRIADAAANPTKASAVAESLQSDMRSHYVGGAIVHQSQIGEQVREIGSRYGPLASYGAAAILGKRTLRFENGNIPSEFLLGMIDVWLFKRGIADRAGAELRLLEQVKFDTQALLDSLTSRVEDANVEVDSWSNRAREAFTSRVQLADARIKRFGQATRALFSRARRQAQHHEALTQRELAELKATFATQVALQEPITFWRNKASRHQKAFWGWAVTFLVVSVGGACGLYYLWKGILVNGDKATGLTDAPLWQIGALVLSGTVYLVTLRIISRLVGSESHLHKVAEERAVMAETFIALVQGKHLAAADTLKLVLSALFKTTTTGLVREDAVPPSLHEITLAGIVGKST